jgi:uncharacterized protein Usg
MAGDQDFRLQLLGYSLTTVEIAYYLPDHPSLLQLFVWQQYDEAPEYPGLRRFLDTWRLDIEAVLHSVTIANDRTMGPRTWRPTVAVRCIQ